ncbi:MAG: 3-hydroxy-5-phosphonooxypentane-2,4-dione thiolase [Candidatus Thermoplasmatota archaeon]|nr:3-hydroxy-5-phosphonooxypentane-2,4-dione thiolase [Candidatus Thermoplasmatota archaeon]
MDWGMSNRMSKIIQKDGKTVMLAVDHGYFMGPTTGLEDIKATIDPLLRHADTLMLTRGALRNYVSPDCRVPMVLRVSGGTSILNENLLHEGTICNIEDAIRLNVAGVAFSIMVGAKFERDTILAYTPVVDDATRYGIPTIAVTAVGKDMVRDARYMGLASRIAAEIGASIVKTYFVEGFEKVVDTCPVPIVIAGGKKTSEKEALETAYHAIQAGACGVDMGRNIFQSEDPAAMIQAVKAVVHKKYTPKEAYQFFNEKKALKKGKKAARGKSKGKK